MVRVDEPRRTVAIVLVAPADAVVDVLLLLAAVLLVALCARRTHHRAPLHEPLPPVTRGDASHATATTTLSFRTPLGGSGASERHATSAVGGVSLSGSSEWCASTATASLRAADDTDDVGLLTSLVTDVETTQARASVHSIPCVHAAETARPTVHIERLDGRLRPGVVGEAYADVSAVLLRPPPVLPSEMDGFERRDGDGSGSDNGDLLYANLPCADDIAGYAHANANGCGSIPGVRHADDVDDAAAVAAVSARRGDNRGGDNEYGAFAVVASDATSGSAPRSPIGDD